MQWFGVFLVADPLIGVGVIPFPRVHIAQLCGVCDSPQYYPLGAVEVVGGDVGDGSSLLHHHFNGHQYLVAKNNSGTIIDIIMNIFLC